MEKVLKFDFVRFCIVGASGFVINFILLTILYSMLGLHLFFAQLIAAELSLFNNFMWHQKWTYKGRAEHKTIWQLLWQFHVTSWVAIVGSAALVSLGVNTFGVPYWMALVFSSAVALFWNFGWTKFIVWRSKSGKIKDSIDSQD